MCFYYSIPSLSFVGFPLSSQSEKLPDTKHITTSEEGLISRAPLREGGQGEKERVSKRNVQALSPFWVTAAQSNLCEAGPWNTSHIPTET